MMSSDIISVVGGDEPRAVFTLKHHKPPHPQKGSAWWGAGWSSLSKEKEEMSTAVGKKMNDSE